MSSDGEMSEEYSQESQGPEFVDEVAREAKELEEDGEVPETDMDEDSDFDPDEPDPSEEEEEDMEEDTVTHYWTVTRDEFPTFPALFDIAHCQPLPDWAMVADKLNASELKAIQTAQAEKDLRAFRRVVRASRDFWDHIKEELSDHIQWTERNLRRIEKHHSKNTQVNMHD